MHRHLRCAEAQEPLSRLVGGLLMSMVVVATSAADAQAVDAVKDHHAQLAGALAVQVEGLVDAASRGDLPGAATTAEALVRWCQAELIPHALAEEQAMYPLSLIHISEPTRRTPISYAVFCLK